MRLKDFAISVEVREQGDWVDKNPDLPGLRIKTRGVNNGDWRRRRDQLLNEIPRHRKMDGVSAEDNDRITALLLAETALLDWEGPEDDDGKQIPFSKEQAREFLLNGENENFRNGCLWAASVVAERWRNGLDTTAKN